MSAEDTVRCNKTVIQEILCGDRRLILNKVYEKNLITKREYNNLKSITKEDEEGHVIELVDKIMDKGENTCQDFLNLLQTDENIKSTYPRLNNLQLNNTCLLSKPVQVCSSEINSDVLPHESSLHTDISDYYAMIHNPRGLCVVINNEEFLGTQLKNRKGTQEDEEALRKVFTHLGFEVVVHNNLTAEAIRLELKELSRRDFLDDDALVVCVLTHGEKGCVFGTDEEEVSVRELIQPFTSGRAPSLAGKPKLFFIQACQGSSYQRGSVLCPPMPRQEKDTHLVLGNMVPRNADFLLGMATVPECKSFQNTSTGSIYIQELCREGGMESAQRLETVPSDADFLLGMATVPECKTFRNTSTGSIYIQELCRQLMRSAQSLENDDILTVLTRVNREVSKGEYLYYKQMPEPRYTLTKKLVLKCV